jgi:phenylacetate-CoA ligase
MPVSFSSWSTRRVIAPLWAWWEGSPYLQVAARLERERGLSADERRARQLEALRNLLAHAARIPFYRDRFGEAGFEPGDLRAVEDLGGLPLLTKDEIREHAGALRSPHVPADRIEAKKTSGSTGVSLRFVVDADSVQWKRGVALWRDGWTGWRLGEPRAMIWGNPPLPTNRREALWNLLLDRQFYLDTLAMDEASMDAFAAEILRRRPTLLFGHAHSLHRFAEHWRDHNLPGYRFGGVLSTAMVLHDFERRTVEETFSTRVFDRYGCEEVSLIASECEAHTGLHVNTDTLVVEVVEDAPGTGEGKVVATDLTNRAMPFIRYEVGDRALLAPDRACPCGRSYPRLARVTGRIADYLRTPEGRLVSGISLTENFATLIPGVAQVQIVQDAPDHLRLRVVPASDYDEASVRRIEALVRERFGPAMRHRIERVDRIYPDPSGKYRFAIYAVGEDRG